MKKLIFLGSFLLSHTIYAQGTEGKQLKGWHLKDPGADQYHGISLDKAYQFVKGKKNHVVIVAVIDSGVDTLHEDLESVLWHNPNEIPGNGIDDDGNGYVDDIYGWNFLGGKDGRNVNLDSHESDRVYHQYKQRFASVSDPSVFSEEDKKLYALWSRAANEKRTSSKSAAELAGMKRFHQQMLQNDSVLCIAMQRTVYTGNELAALTPANEQIKKCKDAFCDFLKANNALESKNKDILQGFTQWLKGEEEKVKQTEQAPVEYRAEIVKDDYLNFNDRFYGNRDVMGGDPFHGTHVSGIIGAVRGNGKGVDGIAANVRIMTLRAVPDGDEHDKDIALAIRYAVDNGARIINMSFGKGLSPEKSWVDEAVRYAESKNVLIVHAAGNEHKNIDTTWNFPNPVYAATTTRASNWMTVGASADGITGNLVAGFSNYGKQEVDVFAPGVQIFSTVPGGNKYDNASGTSMAAPVVTGVAAFLLSYYPRLSAKQLKDILESSVIKMEPLKEISVTGGLVNAYEAVLIAGAIKKQYGRRK